MDKIELTFTMGRKAQDRDLSRHRDRFATWCASKFEGNELVELEPISEDANGCAGKGPFHPRWRLLCHVIHRRPDSTR